MVHEKAKQMGLVELLRREFSFITGNYLSVSLLPQSPFYMAIALTFTVLIIVLFLIHEPVKRAD